MGGEGWNKRITMKGQLLAENLKCNTGSKFKTAIHVKSSRSIDGWNKASKSIPDQSLVNVLLLPF